MNKFEKIDTALQREVDVILNDESLDENEKSKMIREIEQEAREIMREEADNESFDEHLESWD